ncbi:CHAT domain-containing protein [Ekhidna lutea]|uniref:CHAT domain-containing protein n=1 Tax=Ekhidna lutea TaxID=447679 RepID=A0A239E931_EKHLU|nr:CHAT domain-containing protein [Ekhidna lutea]SNS41205.1 CHAT domain-containing protein [Ekhidna lutea]
MKNILAGIFFSCLFSLSHAQYVNQLIAEAEENLEKNHWEQAARGFKNILENYIDDLTYLQRANIYNNVGFLDLQLLDPFEAERNLNLSILYHEEAGIPNQKDYADALLNMGILYLEQVEFDLARRYIQKSLDILDELPGQKIEYWIARSKLAFLYEEAGSYTLALSIYNNCYDQLVASGNDLSPDFAEICSHKGRILILTGDPIEGEKFINLSNTIYQSLGRNYDVQRAESMESLALFYERMGRYGDAEKTLLDALELKKSIPDEAEILIISTLNDLGILYNRLGNISKAREMFIEVVKESEENIGTDHPFYATAKNNLGTLALTEGNVVEARDMFVDALETYRKKFGSNHPYYANTLNNLARVERKLGNNEKAEEYYMEVLRIDEKIYGKDHPDYATTLINVGVLYSSLGREHEAEKYYQEAVLIRQRVLGAKHPAYGSALEYMGMHCLAINKFKEAEKLFREAIEIQIGLIGTLFPIMTEQERQAFFQNITSNIDRYNYIAFTQLEENPDLIKRIFDFQIKTKAILFNTSDKVREKVLESTDPELKSKYRTWQSDKRLLASYYQMGVQELEQLNVNLQYEESQVERQEKELMILLENFAGLLQKVDEDWQTVQNFVKPDHAIVEIVKVKEFKSLTSDESTLFGFTDYTKYLAIIFKNGETEPEYVVLGDDFRTDEQHYTRYKNAMLFNIGAQETYNIFWKPIDEKVVGVNNVLMVPDGIYYKMNPNVLATTTGKHVIDNYYVSYLTSAKDLFRKDVEIFNKKSYLFGNPAFSNGDTDNRLNLAPLPGAAAEIQKIEGLLQAEWNVRSYLDEDANELKIRSAYNPTILHIATHGFYGDRFNFIAANSPINNSLFKSGIYLTGASETFSRFLDGIATIPENDGILTAYEAMNLDLSRTKLVVLSACESGLGEITNGEGVYGLQRAFMVAGARNIITSLSKVDDAATSELMTLFYQKLVETNEVRESLKYAQLKLREKYSDPKVWGAFILTGNG